MPGAVLGNHEFCHGMRGVGLDPVGLVHPRGKIGRGVFKEVARVRSAGAEENSVGGEAGVFGDDVFKCGAGFAGVKEGVGERLKDLVWRDAATLVQNDAKIRISKNASKYSDNTTRLLGNNVYLPDKSQDIFRGCLAKSARRHTSGVVLTPQRIVAQCQSPSTNMKQSTQVT